MHFTFSKLVQQNERQAKDSGRKYGSDYDVLPLDLIGKTIKRSFSENLVGSMD